MNLSDVPDDLLDPMIIQCEEAISSAAQEYQVSNDPKYKRIQDQFRTTLMEVTEEMKRRGLIDS